MSRPLIFAHRGASASLAEHSRAAFVRAIEDGADGVECDVHLSRDGVPVLIHDATVDRTSDGSGAVADMNVAELKGLDIVSWHEGSSSEDYVGSESQFLTLGELLDLLSGAGRDIGIAIEFKHEGEAQDPLALERAVLSLLEQRGWDEDARRLGNIDVSFMSFHPESIGYLTQRLGSRGVCVLLESLEDLNRPEAGDLLAFGPFHGLYGPGLEGLREQEAHLRELLDAGALFRVWTVDTTEDAAWLAGVGVQEITTNKPAELLAYFAANSTQE
ncbi:glycerophosphodiester phosphodiesterase [Haematomicrobium sanguinis]|uniref:glycerophosphodiester phosphodiesterase n=1 Tax=Haematomicrobium sanguinis TaxID=479106 RepID=UPI00055128F9|nr:glycerophosphodiester phosphodiesterase family protein [Haematomicrobium sanguinis]